MRLYCSVIMRLAHTFVASCTDPDETAPFNPCMTNGLAHCYHLGEYSQYTVILGASGVIFNFESISG